MVYVIFKKLKIQKSELKWQRKKMQISLAKNGKVRKAHRQTSKKRCFGKENVIGNTLTELFRKADN